MQELKNLIRGCKHKSLLSKHLLCTGPYSKHFLWINLLPNSPVKQMAIILVLQTMKLSTEKLRRLAKVTRLEVAELGFLSRQALSKALLFITLCGFTCCAQLLITLGFWELLSLKVQRRRFEVSSASH